VEKSELRKKAELRMKKSDLRMKKVELRMKKNGGSGDQLTRDARLGARKPKKNFTFQGLRIRKTETLKREILKMVLSVISSGAKPLVLRFERHGPSCAVRSRM
jgi:hypothetical protein